MAVWFVACCALGHNMSQEKYRSHEPYISNSYPYISIITQIFTYIYKIIHPYDIYIISCDPVLRVLRVLRASCLRSLHLPESNLDAHHLFERADRLGVRGLQMCKTQWGYLVLLRYNIYIIIYITFTENGTAVPDTASSSSWDLMGSHHPCGLVHDSGGFYGIFPRENPPEAGFDMFLSFWSLPCLRDLLAKSQFVGNFDPTDWQVDVSQDQ